MRNADVILEELLAVAVLAACVIMLAGCGAEAGGVTVPATDWKAGAPSAAPTDAAVQPHDDEHDVPGAAVSAPRATPRPIVETNLFHAPA